MRIKRKAGALSAGVSPSRCDQCGERCAQLLRASMIARVPTMTRQRAVRRPYAHRAPLRRGVALRRIRHPSHWVTRNRLACPPGDRSAVRDGRFIYRAGKRPLTTSTLAGYAHKRPEAYAVWRAVKAIQTLLSSSFRSRRRGRLDDLPVHCLLRAEGASSAVARSRGSLCAQTHAFARGAGRNLAVTETPYRWRQSAPSIRAATRYPAAPAAFARIAGARTSSLAIHPSPRPVYAHKPASQMRSGDPTIRVNR